MFLTIYFYLISVILLNTLGVSTFRIHLNSLEIAKYNDFGLFGSKRKPKKYNKRELEEEEDTAVSEDQLDDLHNKCKTKLKSIEEYVRIELSRISGQRASPSLIDYETIETESGETKLKHLAKITTRGNYELVVEPKSSADLKLIFNSLSESLSDYEVKLLGGSLSVKIPESGSKILYLFLTSMYFRNKSRERVKSLQTNGMEQIRLTRQDTIKSLKKLESGLSQDMLFRQKAEIENNAKSSTSRVERMCNDKLASLK